MGIKTLQELVDKAVPGLHFPACINYGNLHFGTPHMSEVIVVLGKTGEVHCRSSLADGEFWEKLHTYLTRELGPAGVVAALTAPDQHGPLTPVYMVDQLDVREEQCEKFGWPNVTIAGERMYENTAYLTKEDAKAALGQNLKALLDLYTKYHLPDARAEAQKAQDRLQRYLDDVAAARQKLLELTGEPYCPEEAAE